jgi:hypothetical protein
MHASAQIGIAGADRAEVAIVASEWQIVALPSHGIAGALRAWIAVVAHDRLRALLDLLERRTRLATAGCRGDHGSRPPALAGTAVASAPFAPLGNLAVDRVHRVILTFPADAGTPQTGVFALALDWLVEALAADADVIGAGIPVVAHDLGTWLRLLEGRAGSTIAGCRNQYFTRPPSLAVALGADAPVAPLRDHAVDRIDGDMTTFATVAGVKRARVVVVAHHRATDALATLTTDSRAGIVTEAGDRTGDRLAEFMGTRTTA